MGTGTGRNSPKSRVVATQALMISGYGMVSSLLSDMVFDVYGMNLPIQREDEKQKFNGVRIKQVAAMKNCPRR